MRKHFTYMVIMALAALSVPGGNAAADWGPTEIMVFCYVGDRNNGENLGTVDVFDGTTAARACNMLYGDCNWSCTGCYDDEDSRELCIDSSGMAYYF